MKFTRKAVAQWQGSGPEGNGYLSTPSTVLNKTPYSFKTRFQDEPGTNPEELIAAAHAGCYTMQLSFLLGEAGFIPTNLETKAELTFEDGNITTIHLKLQAVIKNIGNDVFQEIATKAKEICPVSKVLKATITLSAELQ